MFDVSIRRDTVIISSDMLECHVTLTPAPAGISTTVCLYGADCNDLAPADRRPVLHVLACKLCAVHAAALDVNGPEYGDGLELHTALEYALGECTCC